MFEGKRLDDSNKGKSMALIVAFLTRFSFIFSMQAIPPLLPLIIEEFSLSFTIASSLMWFVALPGVFISILGGILTGKYGVKMFLIIGLSICIFSSLLCFFSPIFTIVQFCRFLLGVGGALAVVSASTLLFEWFEKGRLGMAMGVFGLSMPAGTVLAFNSLGIFALKYGWRGSILITAAINLAALILGLFLIKEKRDTRFEKITLEPFRNIDIWILGLFWAFFNMAGMGYSTWGKTIFTRFYGLPLEFSDILASLLMLGVLIQPITGYFSDILGKRRFLMVISCACMFLILLLFSQLQSAYFLALALMMGFGVSFIPPNTFALSGEILGVKKGALGFGVMNTFLNIGLILGPLSLGYVLDSTESSYLSFLTLAIFALVALIFVTRLRS